MIPAAFDYAAPATIAEAISLLEKHGDEAKILTGGHSLIPILKLRLAQPALVIDLGRIEGLKRIQSDNGTLRIGAAATHHDVMRSGDVRDVLPLLCETAEQIGDVQVRNVGTIGGSVVHADPASDWPAALLATEATMVLQGPRGERTVPAGEFFVSTLESAAEPSEILTEIRIPRPPAGSAGTYLKVAQSASGFALGGVAALVNLDADGDTIREARIGITGVAEKPYRPGAVEAALAGASATEEAVKEAVSTAAEGVDLLEDIHASSRYRANLARVLTRRAVLGAASRARRGGT